MGNINSASANSSVGGCVCVLGGRLYGLHNAIAKTKMPKVTSVEIALMFIGKCQLYRAYSGSWLPEGIFSNQKSQFG
jgi:hypothetical protein